MGKGMAAALLMAMVRAALRGAGAEGSPAAVLHRVQQALGPDLTRAASFVTLFHGRLEAAQRRLVYVDAGHGHGLVFRQSGAVEPIQRGGRPLGFPAARPYQEAAFTFAPGDSLVVYSDGVREAWQDAGLVPPAHCETVLGAPDAAAVVDRLLPRPAPGGPGVDDMTLLVLRATRL
jgi:serine phosphatase RsbU (regulator of sigma subunit)